MFEGFRLDRRGGGLFRCSDSGKFAPVAMGSRALDVLCVLVERHGDLVSKDQLMEAVWPGTVVEDGNLTVQISTLRRILDDGRSQGSCIQTIPGRGYRFVGEVTSRTPSSQASPIPAVDGFPEAGGMQSPPVVASLEAGTAMHTPSRRPPAQRFNSLVLILIAVCLAGLGAGLYVSADHLRLRYGAGPPPRLSIVVLPFADLSDDHGQQYFADAVTEDLTTELSRLSGTFVISRNTAFTFKDKPADAKQIGRELGVRYVVEGSLQRLGNRVRANAQLIDAETAAHLWAERFDRDIDDMFAVQNAITARIANTLSVQLIGAEAARPTVAPDALDYLLRGRAAINREHTRSNFADAIGLFEHALMLDPRSVEAQYRLAIVLAGRVLDEATNTATADIVRAEGLIRQADASSPPTALAHFAKGQLLRVQRRCGEAIAEYEAALASDRNSAPALSHVGRCKTRIGLVEEAIPLQENAIRLSPRDPAIPVFYFRMGEAHLLLSRIDEAIVWLEKARSGNPALPYVRAFLAAAYGLKEDSARAAVELAEARRLAGEGSYASIATVAAKQDFGMPKARLLYETTYIAGLRKAGLPEQ